MFNIIVSVIQIALVILMDQLIKLQIGPYLASFPNSTTPLIENVVHLTYVENRGAAFGMLADHRWVFMILSCVGVAVLLGWLLVKPPKSLAIQYGMAFVIGGGIGNLIDRFRLGYVIDYIDLKFINFYVFNLADAFVCIGCFVIAIGLIIEMGKTKKAPKQEKTGDGQTNNE